MRIGILTFQRTNNYGGCLQAYALQLVLLKQGMQCDIIDVADSSLSLQPTAKAGIAARVLDMITKAGSTVIKRLSNNAFDNFRRKYFRFSVPVTPETIPSLTTQYDLFVSGSDQVWNYNITGNLEIYLQSFIANNHCRRGSYAASFGFDALPESRRGQYRKALSQFEYISVREPEGARIVHDLIGREAKVTLDPTLLLNHQEWLMIAEPLPIHNEFIFVYQLGLSRRLLDFARHLAHRTGLQLVFVPFPVGRFIRGRWYPTLSPAKWIWLVEHARYIVTNSFHGVSFSINFQKTFYVDLSENLSSLGSRITNLLNIAGLTERIIPNEGITNVPLNDIDYTHVTPRIAQARDESLAFLTEMIKGEG